MIVIAQGKWQSRVIPFHHPFSEHLNHPGTLADIPGTQHSVSSVHMPMNATHLAAQGIAKPNVFRTGEQKGDTADTGIS